MVYGQLEQLLIEHEFYKISSNLPEFSIFFRRENLCVNVIQVIDYRQGLYISEDQYGHLKEQTLNFFHKKNITEVHILTLLLSADAGKAKQLCGQDTFCWLIDPIENRMVVYENQVSDFYGMRNILETFLYEAAKAHYENGETSFQERAAGGDAYTAGSPAHGARRKVIYWGNTIIVAANVIVYIACMFTGDSLYNIGAFSIRNIIVEREWYRVITSMFLHADIQHLLSNMLILYYIGNVVEKYTGCVPYAIIYFLSGIMGNMFSAGYEMFTGNYVSSVGASGAVFGIEGALLMLVIIYKGKCSEVTAGRLAFSIAFSLYCGFTSSYVNNAAHIGGLLTGFTAAGICWLFIPEKRRNRANRQGSGLL